MQQKHLLFDQDQRGAFGKVSSTQASAFQKTQVDIKTRKHQGGVSSNRLFLCFGWNIYQTHRENRYQILLFVWRNSNRIFFSGPFKVINIILSRTRVQQTANIFFDLGIHL